MAGKTSSKSASRHRVKTHISCLIFIEFLLRPSYAFRIFAFSGLSVVQPTIRSGQRYKQRLTARAGWQSSVNNRAPLSTPAWERMAGSTRASAKVPTVPEDREVLLV